MTRRQATKPLSIKRRSTQKVRTFLLSGLLVAAALITPVQTIFAADPTYEWSRSSLTSAAERTWSDVASSADGTKLVAAAYQDAVYTSTDGGANWVHRELGGSKYWNSVASSADGTKLAAVSDRGYIYMSSDSGATWTARVTDMERDWYSVASSADGSKLVAVAGYDTIYTSSDGGDTWDSSGFGSGYSWTAVTMSADGTQIAATVDSGQFDEEGTNVGGYIYTFTEGDEEWVQRAAPHRWKSIASSADGTKLIAGTFRDGGYMSIDAGITWTEINDGTILDENENLISWWTATMSANGQNLILAGDESHVLVSEDGGVNWVDHVDSSHDDWASLAYSGDGTLLAGVQSGTAYVRISADNAIHWTNMPVKGTGAWAQILVSNDGEVVVSADMYGAVYRSTNGGDTWTLLPTEGIPLSYLAMSTNGSKMLAAADGGVFTSVDGGANWVARPGADVMSVRGAAMSGDGTKMVIVEADGAVHISNNSGETWTKTTVPDVSWRQVVSSADGGTLFGMPSNGVLYRSDDGGESWAPLSLSTENYWGRVAMSTDGSTLLAFDYGNQLYTSNDSGDTWTTQTELTGHLWSALSSSADGQRMVAATYQDEGIWVSANAGETWVLQEIDGALNKWTNVASSAHGVKLFATEATGWVYTATIPGMEEEASPEEGTPPEEETPTPPVIQSPVSNTASPSPTTGTAKTSTSLAATTSDESVIEESTSPLTIDLMKESAFRAGDEYKAEVTSGQVFSFTANDAPHTFTVDSVQGGTVTFTIRSTPQTHTLRVGETGEYDVDGDKADDISVTVNSVTNGVAQLTMMNLLATKVSVLSMPQDEVADASKSATKPSFNYSLIAWIAGGVVALLIAILIIRKTKRA